MWQVLFVQQEVQLGLSERSLMYGHIRENRKTLKQDRIARRVLGNVPTKQRILVYGIGCLVPALSYAGHSLTPFIFLLNGLPFSVKSKAFLYALHLRRCSNVPNNAREQPFIQLISFIMLFPADNCFRL